MDLDQFTDDDIPAWYAEAACADVSPAVFFPEHGEQSAAAKAVCADCPARASCLEFALNTGQPAGVWGGLTTGERVRLRRERLAA